MKTRRARSPRIGLHITANGSSFYCYLVTTSRERLLYRSGQRLWTCSSPESLFRCSELDREPENSVFLYTSASLQTTFCAVATGSNSYRRSIFGVGAQFARENGTGCAAFEARAREARARPGAKFAPRRGLCSDRQNRARLNLGGNGILPNS
jgi:hypothetical protein